MPRAKTVHLNDPAAASPIKRWNGQTPKAESFPMISEFDRADMDRARELMEEEILYHEQEDAAKAVRAAIKKELAEIARKYSAPGMRWAQLAVYVRTKRKRFFNVKLAAEVIDAETLASCYDQGEPYTEVRVVDLSAPKGKAHAGYIEDDNADTDE